MKETTIENKRLIYMDMAKGIGIFIVVLGHLESISDPLRVWISSFHMPLFFILSGMLIYYRNEKNQPLSTTVAKKFRSIIIPYISFSILFFLIDLIICFGFNLIDIPTVIENVVASCTFYGVSVLWFLTALFIGELGFLWVNKKFSYLKSIIIICVSVILVLLLNMVMTSYEATYNTSFIVSSLLNIVRTFIRAVVASAFIALGYYTFVFFKKNTAFSLRELLLGIALFTANIFLCPINGGVDLHYLDLNNVALYFLFASMGSMGIILICKNCRPIKLLAYYGVNSLIIMITHVNTYVLYFATVISLEINQYVTRAKSYVLIFSIMLLVFVMEYVLIQIFNRYLYFMLGRKIPVKKWI